jgi:hypothetical protein
MLGRPSIEVGNSLGIRGLGFVGMLAAEGFIETDLAGEGERVRVAAFHGVDDGSRATEGGIPWLLKIDPSLDLNELRSQFAFETVSEQEYGFVIVASEDVNLVESQAKLTDFVGAITGSGNIAKIHELREDLTQEERLRLILTDQLFAEWPTMADEALYVCDVSVIGVGNEDVLKNARTTGRQRDRRKQPITPKKVA